MDKLYRYSASDVRGQYREGEIVAPDIDSAYELLTSGGLKVIDLVVDYVGSVSVATSSKASLREVSRVYKTLGRRMEKGGNVAQSVGQLTEFVEDIRLRNNLNLLGVLLSDGMSLGDAMRQAGFSSRDASIVSAMDQAGRSAEAFTSMATEYQQAHQAQSGIKKVLIMPTIFAFLAYILIYASLMFMVPATMEKLIELVGEKNMPPYAMLLYTVSGFLNSNFILSTVAYLAAGVGVFQFIRSQAFSRLMDGFKVVRRLSERSDQAMVWRSFALLYDSGMNLSNSASLVSETAKRTDTREQFEALAEMLASGMSLEQAAQSADFPSYVRDAVGSATLQQTGISDALIEFSDDLFEDVELLVDQLKSFISVATVIGMAALLLSLFAVSYLPMLSAVMQQL